MLTTDSDHFALFGLPRRFSLDLSELASAWREVQAQVHPDRFVTAGAAQKRVAMQWATRANDAYRELRDPLTRGAYLCELGGHPILAETNTSMGARFLTRQLLWREALEEALQRCDVAALHELAQQVDDERCVALLRLGTLLDEQHAYDEAAKQVRELMFICKFADELSSARDGLAAS